MKNLSPQNGKVPMPAAQMFYSGFTLDGIIEVIQVANITYRNGIFF